MTNTRALERRITSLEQQVTGHHRHGTLANRLARLEDTVKGDPMQQSSIAQRLDEIEAQTRGESIPERVDAVLGDAETGDTISDRVATIEARLNTLEDGIQTDRNPADLESLLERIEARLLALEQARRTDEA